MGANGMSFPMTESIKRHVRMLQGRFVPLVESGSKTTTIRGTPKREIRVGDVIDFRTWMGKPYRSKQRKIREVTVTRVRTIEIITLAGRRCAGGVAVWVFFDEFPFEMLWGGKASREFAKADGFSSIADLAQWFHLTHGKQFNGVLIEWKA